MHKNGVLFGWIPKIFFRQIILLRKTKIDVFWSKVRFCVDFLSRNWRNVLVKITEYWELNFEDKVKYPEKIYYFVVWKWTKYAIFDRKSPTINSMNACTDTESHLWVVYFKIENLCCRCQRRRQSGFLLQQSSNPPINLWWDFFHSHEGLLGDGELSFISAHWCIHKHNADFQEKGWQHC